MRPIRVLVVEDSYTVRRYLAEVLAADPELVVVGEAADGKRAIELCGQLRPDVITLDMMLPVMTGLAATEYIMAHFPTPILIVSSSTNRGELFRTYDALRAGAVDVLDKAGGHEAPGAWERKFVETVKLVSRIRVITHVRARLERARSGSGALAPSRVRECAAVAIGASTGGPSALVEVLREIPPTFAVPILVVQHIGESFAQGLADWLDGQTAHRVGWAREGQPLAAIRPGEVVMAPAGRHLVVREGKLQLLQGPERNFCRPSVDTLFESVARELGAAGAGCLLTGMGRDGAAGLLAIRRAGGVTLTQDEASSIVYGMPHEAVVLGAAERVLPLGEIGRAISSIVPARKAGP
ncbi:MAG TPA: chemotaxis-specific protein-glutamate methyltransferase CheB [Myxococcaceae bacterium]|nr:chemotaxis-specific protein-glutamate methyltransferase CheB [Myxococcaceae bacterium]